MISDKLCEQQSPSPEGIAAASPAATVQEACPVHIVKTQMIAAARTESPFLRSSASPATDHAKLPSEVSLKGAQQAMVVFRAEQPPFLKPSCVPACFVRHLRSPLMARHASAPCDIAQHCSAPSDMVLPTTPPRPVPGKRPRPRPLASLALAEAAAVGIARQEANEINAPEQGIRQQLKAPTISPSKQSDASTATPTDSAKFGSPSPSLQTSPTVDQTGTTPVGNGFCSTPGSETAQLWQESCTAMVEIPTMAHAPLQPRPAMLRRSRSMPATCREQAEACVSTSSDPPSGQRDAVTPCACEPSCAAPPLEDEEMEVSAILSAPSNLKTLRPLSTLSRTPSHTVLSSVAAVSSSRGPFMPSHVSPQLQYEHGLRGEDSPAPPNDSDHPGELSMETDAMQMLLEAMEACVTGDVSDCDSRHFKNDAQDVPHKVAEIAEARDALDAALLWGAESMREDVPQVQRRQAKEKASDALGLALLTEARESGIDVTPAGLLKAKGIAQGALDFRFLTERNLELDADTLDELKIHAEDAVQVGLLAMERAADVPQETLSPRLQSSALDALEELLCVASQVLHGELSGKGLADARQRARGAVARAVACEAQCSGIDVTQEELQRALERACLALDSVALTEPELRTNLERTQVKQRALHSLHLAMLGV